MTYDVSPAMIRAHASEVAPLASRLDMMQKASSISGDSYGLLLQWLPGMFNSLNGDIESSLTQVATNAEQAVNGLRSMADQYESDDTSATWNLRRAYP